MNYRQNNRYFKFELPLPLEEKSACALRLISVS